MAAMTTTQLATLKTDIQARANLWTAGKAVLSDQGIADFYNTTANPVMALWKPVVTVQEMTAAITWDGTGMASLTQEKQLTYQSLIWTNVCDMTDAQVRKGITAIFGAASASEIAIFAFGQRSGTYLEALFATGGSTPKKSVMFGLLLQAQDVTNALSV